MKRHVNVLYIDTETTGPDMNKDAIIQLAGFLKVDGEEVGSFNYKIKPYTGIPVSYGATAVHGITDEEAQQYPSCSEAYKAFTTFLKEHGIGPDNKAFVCGYNVNFDVTLLKGLFQKNRDFGLWKNYVYSGNLEVMDLASIAVWKIRFALSDVKLSTIYKVIFNETFNAHDAMADIRATQKLFDYINHNLLNDYFDEKFFLNKIEEEEEQPELNFNPSIPTRQIKSQS